ncbi:hypothetical protein ACFFRR_000181 [Megaselia abdita]
MVRPKNQHKYKQYEDRFNPTTQFETMFASAAKSASKKDSVKLSPPNPNQSQKKRERKDEKTQYNEQALAINSKSKVDKSSNGANKSRNYLEQPNQQHHHHHNLHQHQHQQPLSSNGDDEKDTDDSEEFFQLIRETVAESVKKTMKEVLDKNIKGLVGKVDEIADELKQMQSKVVKLQNEVAAKVVHYGEENSRHFRYLCMKSEYDKLFYQHQTMVQYPSSQQQSVPVQSKDSVLFTHRVPSQSNYFPADVDLNLPANINGLCSMCTTRDGKPLHGQGDQPKNIPTNSELALKEIIEKIQKVYPQSNKRSKVSSKGNASPKYEINEDDEESSPAFEDNNSNEIDI